MRELETRSLFTVADSSIAYDFLEKYPYPWLILSEIGKIITEIGKGLGGEYEQIEKDVWVAADASVAASALIKGPCIIDKGAEVRHCAFLRGNAIIGKGAVVGNSTEIKNSIVFDGAQLPHYNYVGDSLIGYRAHMGAGSITSNIKGDKSNIKIRGSGEIIDTGLRKIGAFLGDFAEIGCGTVLNPGAVVGVSAQIYPLCSVRGYVRPSCIYKGNGAVDRR